MDTPTRAMPLAARCALDASRWLVAVVSVV